MDSIDQPIKSERMDSNDQSMEPETVDDIDQSMEPDTMDNMDQFIEPEERQEIRRAYEAKIKNLERSLEVCRVKEDSLFALIHQTKVREERL